MKNTFHALDISPEQHLQTAYEGMRGAPNTPQGVAEALAQPAPEGFAFPDLARRALTNACRLHVELDPHQTRHAMYVGNRPFDKWDQVPAHARLFTHLGLPENIGTTFSSLELAPILKEGGTTQAVTKLMRSIRTPGTPQHHFNDALEIQGGARIELLYGFVGLEDESPAELADLPQSHRELYTSERELLHTRAHIATNPRNVGTEYFKAGTLEILKSAAHICGQIRALGRIVSQADACVLLLEGTPYSLAKMKDKNGQRTELLWELADHPWEPTPLDELPPPFNAIWGIKNLQQALWKGARDLSEKFFSIGGFSKGEATPAVGLEGQAPEVDFKNKVIRSLDAFIARTGNFPKPLEMVFRRPPDKADLGNHHVDVRYLPNDLWAELFGRLAELPAEWSVEETVAQEFVGKDGWRNMIVGITNPNSPNALMQHYLRRDTQGPTARPRLVRVEVPDTLPDPAHEWIISTNTKHPPGVVETPALEAERELYLGDTEIHGIPVSLDAFSYRDRYVINNLVKLSPVIRPIDIARQAQAFRRSLAETRQFVDRVRLRKGEPPFFDDFLHEFGNPLNPNRQTTLYILSSPESAASHLNHFLRTNGLPAGSVQFRREPQPLEMEVPANREPQKPQTKESLSLMEREAVIINIVKHYEHRPRVSRTLRKYEAHRRSLTYSTDSEKLFRQEMDRYRLLTDSDVDELFGQIDRGVDTYLGVENLEHVPPDSEAEQALIDLVCAYNLNHETK